MPSDENELLARYWRNDRQVSIILIRQTAQIQIRNIFQGYATNPEKKLVRRKLIHLNKTSRRKNVDRKSLIEVDRELLKLFKCLNYH